MRTIPNESKNHQGDYYYKNQKNDSMVLADY